MAMWEDYLAGVEKDLEQLRLDLAPLKNGEMKLAEQRGDGQWRDVTQERIDHIEQVIGTYERIADAVKKRIPF